MSFYENPKTIAAFSGLRTWTKRLLLACTPSFLQSRLSAGPEINDLTPPTKPRPASARTAYLDGLRGVASLFVFFGHLLWTYHPWTEWSYGDGPWNYHIIQLPPIRLLYSGHAMVSLFFVVGGYVSSAKAIKLARSKRPQHDKVYLTLTSSLFRRGLRLYLPALVSTFISMWTIRAGLWEPARAYITMPYMYTSDNHHQRLPSLHAQLVDWWSNFMGLTNIWSYYNYGFVQLYYNSYDPHLWTVPMEMRGGLVVMVALLAFLRCRVVWRFVLMAALAAFCVYWDRWECMDFVIGAMLAELHMVLETTGPSTVAAVEASWEPNSRIDTGDYLRTTVEEEEAYSASLLLEKPLPQHQPTHFASLDFAQWTRSQAIRRYSRIALFIFALYVFSAPNHRFEFSPGYSILSHFIPSSISDPKRFVHGIGAALLILSVSSTTMLRKIFEHAIPQYLGKISYSLYICHGPVIHMVGMYLTPTIWSVIGYGTMWGWLIGFLLGGCVVFAIVIWAADLFWRVVDKRCVTFARWAEGVCFRAED